MSHKIAKQIRASLLPPSVGVHKQVNVSRGTFIRGTTDYYWHQNRPKFVGAEEPNPSLRLVPRSPKSIIQRAKRRVKHVR